MVALRSRRLETIFGTSLDNIEPRHILGLVTGQVSESFDLDFKASVYGNGDSDRRALAGDVAALANTGGGVIVLGIEEDAQGRAAGTPRVAVTDAEVSRMRQIVASLVTPLPVFDIVSIDDASTLGHGFLVIAIPRSPLGPHAVLVNDALRFPRRNGATTRYLSEPEVADAYRNRFRGGRQQLDRIREVEGEAQQRLGQARDYAWLMVSLVPDLPGEFSIDRSSMGEFQREIINTSPSILPNSISWLRAGVGRRRLVADGGEDRDSGMAAYVYTELHQDGAGAFGMVVADVMRRNQFDQPEASTVRRLDDEQIVNAMTSALLFLSKHSRDRAAAGGDALVSATFYPVTEEFPTQLGHLRGMGGMGGQLGARTLQSIPPVAERVVGLEDIGQPGPALVSAAYLLATDLFQEFGYPEVLQLSRDGRIRTQYWGQAWRQYVERWATASGIELTDETVA